MASGPAEGLEVVDVLTAERALQGHPQLPAVRGDLLAKLGRLDEARQAFERAATLTRAHPVPRSRRRLRTGTLRGLTVGQAQRRR
jgi:predicted RNA polymerase sigma factor